MWLDPLCLLTKWNVDLSDNTGFPPKNMAGDPDYQQLVVWVTWCWYSGSVFRMPFLIRFPLKLVPLYLICIVCEGCPSTPPRRWVIKGWMGDPLEHDPLQFCFRMSTENNGQHSYLDAYAASCLGWKCLICSKEAQDQIGIHMQFVGDEKVVFTDSIDDSKWVFCTTCKQAYHLSCVTSCTEQQVEAKGWPFICSFNECQGQSVQAGHPSNQPR